MICFYEKHTVGCFLQKQPGMRSVTHFPVRSAEQLPALLKAFRATAGLTQDQVAKRLGVTQQTLSALERNAQKVSAERLIALLSILGAEVIIQTKAHTPDKAHPEGAPTW